MLYSHTDTFSTFKGVYLERNNWISVFWLCGIVNFKVELENVP